MNTRHRFGKIFSLACLSLLVATAVIAPTATSAQGDRRARHVDMMRALRALQTARASLQHAGDRYKGHREAAMGLVDKAISEVNQAMAAADREHY